MTEDQQDVGECNEDSREDGKTYYGTKRITAWEEYGPLAPGSEMKEGYAVRYPDGYTSWSPKGVFEAAYQLTTAMSFGHAIVAMKDGHRVCRSGWNGKGMFLYLVQGSNFKVNRPPLLGIYEEGHEINYLPHIDMKTADDKCVPWLASQTDILADDWMIVE